MGHTMDFLISWMKILWKMGKASGGLCDHQVPLWLWGPRMKIAVAAGVAAHCQTATKWAIRSVVGIRSGVAVRFEKIAKKI